MLKRNLHLFSISNLAAHLKQEVLAFGLYCFALQHWRISKHNHFRQPSVSTCWRFSCQHTCDGLHSITNMTILRFCEGGGMQPFGNASATQDMHPCVFQRLRVPKRVGRGCPKPTISQQSHTSTNEDNLRKYYLRHPQEVNTYSGRYETLLLRHPFIQATASRLNLSSTNKPSLSSSLTARPMDQTTLRPADSIGGWLSRYEIVSRVPAITSSYHYHERA